MIGAMALGFAEPLVLVGLLTLPVLWWLSIIFINVETLSLVWSRSFIDVVNHQHWHGCPDLYQF